MIVSSIFIIIIPLALTVIILMGIGIKTIPNQGGENVIKNIYIYLVLFATLMMTIGGSVASFMAIADIVAPAPYYQTFEEFKNMDIERKVPNAAENDNSSTEKISDEELKKRYDAIVLAEKEQSINRAKNDLIKSLGWIIIPFPIFIYFQRRLTKKEA